MANNHTYYIPDTITSYVDDEDGRRVLCENGKIIGRELPDGYLTLVDPDDPPWSPEALWCMYQGCATSNWVYIHEDETLPPEEREALITATLEEAAAFYFYAFGERKDLEFIKNEIKWPLD
jgi:hypothetical protein